MTEMNLWVAVPFLDEEKLIAGLLHRLLAMAETGEDFQAVFCDNGSTDSTVDIINQFAVEYSLPWVVIHEGQKGTGAAADTAIRYAIEHGATHVARTDADCLPAEDWLTQIRETFMNTGTRYIAGKIQARTDDTKVTRFQEKVFNGLVPLAALFGKVRPLNKGDQYKGPYVMTAGCNVAIESTLYINSGGFPRTKIEEVHEDHVLINRVRETTDKYGYYPNVLVKMSARRITEWGIVNTLRWYANHSYCPPNVDIR
jgi:glycosyltransferase involved in cell wall biosynthesis